MISGSRKRLLPLFVLLLAAVGLLSAWWLSSTADSRSAATRRHSNDGPEVSSTLVLRKLTTLRDTKSLREFTTDAGEIIRQDQTLSASEAIRLGNELYRDGYLETSELCYRKALAIQNSNETATLRLTHLLYATGRIDEARIHLTELLLSAGIDTESLPLLGNSDLTWSADAEVIQRHDRENADLTTLLSQAWIALGQQNIDLAMSLLDAAESLPTAANNRQRFLLRAECFSRSGKTAELVELFGNASSEQLMERDDVLCLQGQLCRNLGESDSALRCFWEAFQVNPNSYRACTQLSELLEMKMSTELAAQLRSRSKSIRDYADICREIHLSDVPAEQQLAFAASVSVKLSCLRESFQWCMTAEHFYPDATWPQIQMAALQSSIRPNDRRFSQLHEWIGAQDFSSYSLPDWQRIRSRVTSDSPNAATEIVFLDDSNTRGIQFQYEDAAIAGSASTRLFEFTGGGVAVLDADLDGWPDVFFTQGGDAPSLGNVNSPLDAGTQPSPVDQLFRNIRGQSFRAVTESSYLNDGGYSQGCSSGDFDMDGFPDLYVANIGQNQLFRNNGDGTFDAVTIPSSETWTTSCAIADVTGDGIPDIYDVNHMTAANVHTLMCKNEGTSVPCRTQEILAAEQDRLFAGDGHGGFTDITDVAGIRAADGLGLGLLILQLDDTPALSIFVANDARPNFLFVNHGKDAHPQFSEEAITRGIALSGEGYRQACMGVAAGDADGNGATDLFVTNFFADYNTLYLQQESFFRDSSARANLVQPSYNMLGFGTQFLDADLDGDPDLIVTNGDVVDFSDENPSRPYAQRLQLFKNRSGGTFEEQTSVTSGSAFQNPHIGRGLARLDWNADGLPDFVTSNVRSAALLATNQTTKTGHYLALRLVGTRSPRHPVGTFVRVFTATGELYGQLTAGDGYQACNENVLLFGLGSQTLPVKLTIQWPSGYEQSLPSVPVDSSQTIVEAVTFKPGIGFAGKPE